MNSCSVNPALDPSSDELLGCEQRTQSEGCRFLLSNKVSPTSCFQRADILQTHDSVKVFRTDIGFFHLRSSVSHVGTYDHLSAVDERSEKVDEMSRGMKLLSSSRVENVCV